jgi:hypothetical protein
MDALLAKDEAFQTRGAGSIAAAPPAGNRVPSPTKTLK